MLIKICGLTDPKEAEYLNRNQVDMAGMVLFFPKSKRNIDIKMAKSIIAALAPEIKKVAVVVKPGLEEAKAICQAGFDYIQIHGNVEDALYENLTIPVLKAFNVNDLKDFPKYQNMEQVKGYVFDAHEPGSGKSFDWTMLKELPTDEKLCILAGGLNPETVRNAIKIVKPDGVDVSSGVENDSGYGKNPVKIDKFVDACRNDVQNV